MGEGVRYWAKPYPWDDWSLSDGVKIWVPTGRGFYFPHWDWTDAPYRKGDDREVSGTGEDE